jgi:3',5'-cyclic AMP phosphodiesterase CpdA
VPGNHDYAWKGNVWQSDAWRHWVKYLGSPLGWPQMGVPWMGVEYEPEGIDGLGVWKDGKCVYFGIDSGDPNNKQRMARGYISKKLAGALAQSLRKYAGKTRIAILHHHPFTTGLDAIFKGLHGSARLVKALKDNCEVLLFGHQHEYGIWWGKNTVPLTVSSHKVTRKFSGDCLAITIIEIDKPGTPNVSFRHRLEVL